MPKGRIRKKPLPTDPLELAILRGRQERRKKLYADRKAIVSADMTRRAEVEKLANENKDEKLAQQGGYPAELTAANKKTFLSALSRTFTVRAACDAAGITRAAAYAWRKTDHDFAEEWAHSLQDSADHIEERMFERAQEKDTLSGIFLLKGRRPEIYKDHRSVTHTGPDGGPVQIQVWTDVVRSAKEHDVIDVTPEPKKLTDGDKDKPK